MAKGLRSNFRQLDAEALAEVPATLGVYEVVDENGGRLALGYAGGRSTFGLRGELRAKAAEFDGPLLFRVEVTSQYLSRYKELTELGDSAGARA